MHTAYQVHQLLKLPLTVESMVSFGDNLLVGTKQGHLLMYSVKASDQDVATAQAEEEIPDVRNSSAASDLSNSSTTAPPPLPPPRVQLLRTNKFFSDKPISQLAAVPEYSILVSLSGGVLRVHDMDLAVMNFPVVTTVSRARGAAAFAVDLLKQRTLTGETGVAVRMAVAVRKKLQFYYWKNRRFHDLYTDVSLPDAPRSLAWCRDSVCVGFRGEYALIRVGRGGRGGGDKGEELCELFPTGKNQEASVTLMSDGERFALGKDEQTTFIDLEGNMKLYAVQWSETPIALANDPPYLLAVLNKSVEVRTDEPRLNIQTVELNKPRFISTPAPPASADSSSPSSTQGIVYVASQTHIWCLRMVPVSVQVPQLIRDKQFELAGALSRIAGAESLDGRARRVQQIQTLSAFDLFCNFRFREAMEVFYQLDVDTSHVVGLVADLLPEQHRQKLSYPDKVPRLQGRELENALLALAEYLTKVRHRLNGLPADKRTLSPLSIADGQTIRSPRHMLQIVDTTLLKCYVRTNASLVAPLLRLKDNQCHVDEAVRVLNRSHRHAELVIFYNTKGAHDKALKLLKEHHGRGDSPLKSHIKTVQYLQNLGQEHWEAIREFAPWVFDISEADGLSVFTEEATEAAESLQRTKVLDFLAERRRSAAIPYLRHVIDVWRDRDPVFHTALALEYKRYVLDLRKNEHRLPELPGGRVYGATVEEARRDLREFLLRKDSNFDAALLEREFPPDSLEEERCLLLGRLGRHREALSILLYRLKDVDGTVKYCERHKGESGASEGGVHSAAFRLMLRAPEAALLRSLNLPINTRPPEGAREQALRLLEGAGSRVDLATALECLPDDLPVSAVARFLGSKMEERVSRRNHERVLRGLLHAEHLQVQEERISLESQMVRVTETMLCRLCHKRFRQQGAIVRRPNGEAVHLSCHEKNLAEPPKQ